MKAKKDDIVELLRTGEIPIYVNESYQQWLDGGGQSTLDEECPKCGSHTTIEHQRVHGESHLVEWCDNEKCDYECALKTSLSALPVAKAAG